MLQNINSCELCEALIFLELCSHWRRARALRRSSAKWSGRITFWVREFHRLCQSSGHLFSVGRELDAKALTGILFLGMLNEVFEDSHGVAGGGNVGTEFNFYPKVYIQILYSLPSPDQRKEMGGVVGWSAFVEDLCCSHPSFSSFWELCKGLRMFLSLPSKFFFCLRRWSHLCDMLQSRC